MGSLLTFLKQHRLLILSAIGILVIAFVFGRPKDETALWTTETVTRGEVSQIVSVSGVVEATDKADLSFPTTGIVEEVLVRPGDTVVLGQVLATLEQDELVAERKDAQSAIIIAQANYDELVSGPSDADRDVTDVEVAIARDNLARITAEENEKVKNAYRTLLSSDLEALPVDKDNEDIPPTVSGTYLCAQEGMYTLDVFRSSAQSGSSYRLSGLETGTYTAHTETPTALGTCGLNIQFDATETYASKAWTISIPNTRSAHYVTNLNAYQLALQQRDNTVSAATQALAQAETEQARENALPRNEALARESAAIAQAQARLGAVEARISNRTLRAPFAGVVSSVDIVPGEAVSASTALTLVADTLYELTVRIPEIDITKIQIGQMADVIFDARAGETVPATIAFIAPLATEIDGVAYFEARLRFTTPPTWLRSGLNADVDIIVDKRTDVLRLPRRFLIGEEGNYHVLTPDNNTTVTTTVEVGFIGNNGFAEVRGLEEGATVVAP